MRGAFSRRGKDGAESCSGFFFFFLTNSSRVLVVFVDLIKGPVSDLNLYSLITSEASYFPTDLLAICISSFMNRLPVAFAHFFVAVAEYFRGGGSRG